MNTSRSRRRALPDTIQSVEFELDRRAFAVTTFDDESARNPALAY